MAPSGWRWHTGRMADFITPSEFDASDVGDWRLVGDGVCAFFATGTLAAGARFVQAIAALPGVEDHPPDIDVRPEAVTVRLLTMGEDGYGPTRRDVEMARKISAAAQSLHLAADPSKVQSVLVIPGASDTAAVMPFWEAMLGYVRRPDSPEEDLVDPRRRGPSFWFERMEETRPDGMGAVHVSVWVPYEQAELRIQAALSAGGRMVRDEFAPMWWTLSDAAGNEADISTAKGRE